MTDEPDRPSLWKQASEPCVCPFCGAWGDYLERKGHEWLCNCCSKTWQAVNENDAKFLKSVRIDPH